MIKLNKLYSETNLFKSVEFIPGINIIRGIYKSKETDKSELNGIGKSTLIRLLDFILLSDTARTNFFNVKKHSFLNGHSVSLEFEVDKKVYFLKRSFDDARKPLFGNNSSSLDAYQQEELKRILGDQFFINDNYNGIIESDWFRSLIKFFIKDDINHFQRTDPLNFIDVHSRKFQTYSYNLFLLDLPNKSVTNFDVLTKQVNDLRKQKNRLLVRLKDDTGKKIQEITTEVRQLDEKIDAFQKSVNNYKFLTTYKDVEEELIKISSSISDLLSKLNIYNRKLAEYKKSYRYEVEFDKDKIVKLYSELKETVASVVSKELNDVLDFRKRLSENRMKFLVKKESELQTEIEKLNEDISKLEERRVTLYKILDEKRALDSIKNTYSLLIEEKTKKERLTAFVSQIDDIDKRIYKLNQDITKTISDISSEINSTQDKINKISSLFFEIIEECIKTDNKSDITFDIRPNPDITSPLDIAINVPKSDALGKSRLKILSYDLTVFFTIIQNKRHLPFFLAHDGVFHGIDIKTVIKVLNYVNSKHLRYPDFQYIVTANENEIFIPEDKKSVYGHYNFNIEDKIIVTYTDNPEEMIFKQEY